MENATVRPMTYAESALMVDYFLSADRKFLLGMGADPDKFPTRDQWLALLQEDFEKPFPNRSFYYVIWLLGDQAVGHSNINKIQFGEAAYMHLHLWKPLSRQKGLGTYFVRRSIPFYFQHFNLKRLYCEPYALNPAPNKTLPKLGFEFVETYEGKPGWINLHQQVNKYVLNDQAAKRFL